MGKLTIFIFTKNRLSKWSPQNHSQCQTCHWPRKIQKWLPLSHQRRTDNMSASNSLQVKTSPPRLLWRPWDHAFATNTLRVIQEKDITVEMSILIKSRSCAKIEL